MNGVVNIAYADIHKRIKRRRRRFKGFLFIIVLCIVVIFLFKTPVFKVRNLDVDGNNIVSSEEIVELSGIVVGENLLKLNIRQINEKIMDNPYVEISRIKRSPLGDVHIIVNERKSSGIIQYGPKYVTIDKKGVIIEILDKKEGITLPTIVGLEITNAVPGKLVELNDERRLNALKKISDSLKDTGLSDIINEIDINNLLSITIKTKHEINIKIGDIDNIQKKLIMSKTIMEQDIMEKGLKGTIDVSFNGNPVFREEINQEELE